MGGLASPSGVGALASVLVLSFTLLGGCEDPPPAPRPAPPSQPNEPEADERAPQPPRESIPCEDVTEESTSDGAVRLRFDRLSVGMSPTLCGLVAGPDDPLPFARYLQDRLRREPGCGACEINRIDLVTLLDVTLDLNGRWRPVGSSGDRRFVTHMSSPFDPTSSPEVQLEDAHFYFLRDGEGYEAFYEGLCPGSNPDPSAPGPRVVSEECMRFIERSAPHMSTPGLLREEP